MLEEKILVQKSYLTFTNTKLAQEQGIKYSKEYRSDKWVYVGR
jgi:hypothetical protein